MNSSIDSFSTNEKKNNVCLSLYIRFYYSFFHHVHKTTNIIIMQLTVYPYLFNSDKD